MHLKCIGYSLEVSFCCDVYIIVHVPTVFHTRCVNKFVWYLCTKFHISNACSSLVIITLKNENYSLCMVTVLFYVLATLPDQKLCNVSGSGITIHHFKLQSKWL